VRLFRALEERRVIFFIHTAAPMEVGDHNTGVDGVHADAVRRELQRGTPRQLIDAGLAHTVGEHAGK
jgi:hypothetical protein